LSNSWWPKDLDPRNYSAQDRQFIKVNERVRQLEAVVKKLKGEKKK